MDSYDVSNLMQVSYLNSQVACALIELEAMKAANTEREMRGESIAYTEEVINGIIVKYGIHHNGVMTTLYPR